MAAATFALPLALTTFSANKQKAHFPSLSLNRPLAYFRCSSHPYCSKIPSLRAKTPIPVLSSSTAVVTLEGESEKPAVIVGKRVLFGFLIWVALTFASYIVCGASLAADNSIKASGFGLKVATALRRSGWADEAIVFTLATLPVLELRGAIPVGYWMELNPLHLTVLSILGNMVPVPFLVLYLKRFASFISRKSASATRIFDLLFERAREKAGPVEEFQWLGLMLFVAVPFPGTGAWTGAIIASILDIPLWSAVSANFAGVVLAGLLVNLLMNLGLKYAILTGLLMFFVSTVMWSVLRSFKKSLKGNDG
ncbi:uncharacterized protein [Typha angustifolia]|uniref:uncharacterized protein n=1 Tax=Typha angustifolia TaxID=59011 RepID=UPI003C2E7E3B